MDERLKTDSSKLGVSVPDSIRTQDNSVPIKAREWVSGVSIVLILSIALFLLFNTRSQ